MKHVCDASLDRFEELLTQIRDILRLREKKRGVFYLRGAALLPFHEEPPNFFAAVKFAGSWLKRAVNTGSERAWVLELLTTIVDALGRN